jgi:hypothetical protein
MQPTQGGGVGFEIRPTSQKCQRTTNKKRNISQITSQTQFFIDFEVSFDLIREKLF